MGSAIGLDRYEQGKGGRAASFRADRAQSEWRGDLALAPDESRLAAVFPDVIAVLDPATLAPLVRIETTAGTIAWSPDGRYLAATPDLHYRDSGRAAYVPAPEIAVWDTMTGKLARRFVAPAYATHVAFGKDGSRLVGSGYPGMLQTIKAPADLSPPPAPITTFVPSGDPIAFEVDLRTGTAAATTLPAFVGATRELIATPRSIVAISTGAPVATLASPVIGSGVFSGDFSMLLATEDLDANQSTNTHLVSVADGHMVASLQTFWGSYGPALALSRNGRRVQLDYEIYCLVDRR